MRDRASGLTVLSAVYWALAPAWACAIWPWRCRKRPSRERRRLLRGEFVSLGRQLAGVVPVFPRYTREECRPASWSTTALRTYERAYARGKGVLFLTATPRCMGALGVRAFATRALRCHIVMRPVRQSSIIDAADPELPHHARQQAPSPKTTFVRGLLWRP
jgi:hypothetical protein